VCDIERVLEATQTKVSRHLKYLKSAGFVNDRRKGLWMLYSIAEPMSSEHSLILSCVSRAARSHTAGRGDLQQLTKDITSGCCTTFETIKPAAIPPQLKTPKQRKEHHV
jgi:ArsR family transcriptional regulator